MTKYKTYKRKEFDEWCEDNFIDDDLAQGIWKFINKQEVALNLKQLSQNEAELIVKVKLTG